MNDESIPKVADVSSLNTVLIGKLISEKEIN